MIIAVLLVFGLALGSFVNALVWRLHEQAQLQEKLVKLKAKKAKPSATSVAKIETKLHELSISTGRSMCTECGHTLAWYDLLPVISWASLGGKCRYCRKPISAQYPLVELTTAALSVLSYVYWPLTLGTSFTHVAPFGLWLCLLVGFMALIIYDLRWMLLPNRIIYPLGVLAALIAIVDVAGADRPLKAVIDTALSVVVGGGIFYAIYQLSAGKWIGGGDVKLGWILGLILATPARAFLMIFAASILGSLVSLPLVSIKRLKSNSVIPFGPFLIVGTIIVQLFGATIIAWYTRTLINP